MEDTGHRRAWTVRLPLASVPIAHPLHRQHRDEPGPARAARLAPEDRAALPQARLPRAEVLLDLGPVQGPVVPVCASIAARGTSVSKTEPPSRPAASAGAAASSETGMSRFVRERLTNDEGFAQEDGGRGGTVGDGGDGPGPG